MEDISEKLSQLLNSPDGMEKIKAAANQILGNSVSYENEKKSKESPSFTDINSELKNTNNISETEKIIKIINLIKSGRNDSRINLLSALKPHLSTERSSRVDKAISMLKIASVLPILKEEGLLDDFFI